MYLQGKRCSKEFKKSILYNSFTDIDGTLSKQEWVPSAKIVEKWPIINQSEHINYKGTWHNVSYRKVMAISSSNGLIFLLLLFAFCAMQINAADNLSCPFRSSPCFGKKIPCPSQCPQKSPSDPKAKVCYLDCVSPICRTQCKSKIILCSFHMTPESCINAW